MFKKRLLTALIVISLLALVPAVGIAKGPVGGGGGGDIPDTGDLYGDLYVILRDIDGVPELDEFGCVQPIDEDGNTLALYTNEAEDIYCEVTEELALHVQTVDFGRLNEGRAPDAVMAHAFDEAINAMNSASAIALDPAGRIVLTIGEELKTIDSPLENLALYIKMMQDGNWITTDTTPITKGGQPDGKGPSGDDGPSTVQRPQLSDAAKILLNALGFSNLTTTEGETLGSNELLLGASLLAAAGDKSGTITLDMVVYINSIYGINQLGSIVVEETGKTYYDFGTFSYGRGLIYGQRGSTECTPAGSVWVLVSTSVVDQWEAECLDILTSVTHFRGDETLNVRGFVQAADDALQVIEYIHNYRVPEILPTPPE